MRLRIELHARTKPGPCHWAIFHFSAAALLLSSLALSAQSGSGAAAVSDFTFIQASDVHAPITQSKSTIAKIHGLGAINLAPFGLQAAKPSFVIMTGDLNEFGGGSGWWETYQSYWKGCALPHYPVLGNHDNTWHANIKPLRGLGCGPYYSFDQHGCHFVALMTATAQDPRPSLGEEQILWLKKDLEKVGSQRPVFVFFHHPLPGMEFASSYDYDRLLDVLHDYNTVLLLAGHSHGYGHQQVEGLDQITGGSTFGPNAGFAVVSVKAGVLRAAYWKADQPAPSEKLIEKPIPAKSSYPRIEIFSPAFRSSCGSALTISARLSGPVAIERATYRVDDEDDAVSGPLTLTGAAPQWTAAGSVELGKLLPGAHYLRVDFATGKEHYTRNTEFFFETPSRPTAWRAYLAASSKVTPTVAAGLV